MKYTVLFFLFISASMQLPADTSQAASLSRTAPPVTTPRQTPQKQPPSPPAAQQQTDTIQQTFTINSPGAPSRINFGATSPGPVYVDFSWNGPPLAITLMNDATRQVVASQSLSPSTARLTYTISPADIQTGYFWTVAVSAAAPVSGTIRIISPKADQSVLNRVRSNQPSYSTAPPNPPRTQKQGSTDAAPTTQPATVTNRIETIKRTDLNRARKDMSDVRQNIDTTGLNTGAPAKKGGLSDLSREHDKQPLQTEENKKASEMKNFGLIGERVIKGADADTFGGERINSKHTGDTGNFRGSTSGNAGGGTAGSGNKGGSGGNTSVNSGNSNTSGSLRGGGMNTGSGTGLRGGMPGGDGRGSGTEGGGTGKGSNKTDPTIAEMLRMEGGTPSGDNDKDMAELSYAQSVGPDGYKATKNMNAEQRAAYWTEQRNTQGMGTDEKPREDAESSGSGAPVGTTRAMQRQNTRAAEKALEARKNKGDGGSDDQRVEQSGSGGPVMRVEGKDDRPAKARDAGTINLDKVLEINETVNPVRN